jgi:type IV pilus assembly protein PilZ
MGDTAGSEAARRYPRFEVEIWVDFTTLDTVTSSYVLNLSQGGVFIKSEAPLPLDADVDLVLTLPSGDPVQARGRVVWNHDLTHETEHAVRGCGIQFLSIPDGDRKLLRDYLDALSSRGKRRNH